MRNRFQVIDEEVKRLLRDRKKSLYVTVCDSINPFVGLKEVWSTNFSYFEYLQVIRKDGSPQARVLCGIFKCYTKISVWFSKRPIFYGLCCHSCH